MSSSSKVNIGSVMGGITGGVAFDRNIGVSSGGDVLREEITGFSAHAFEREF